MGKHNFKFRAFSRISTARWKRLVRGYVPRAFPIVRLAAAERVPRMPVELLAWLKKISFALSGSDSPLWEIRAAYCAWDLGSSPFLSRGEYLGTVLLSFILIFNLFTGHLRFGRFGTMRRPSSTRARSFIKPDRDHAGARGSGIGRISRVSSGFRAPSKRSLGRARYFWLIAIGYSRLLSRRPRICTRE